MSDYADWTLAEIADAARASNPELGAIDNTLVNYYSGRQNAAFEDFEGDTDSGNRTAIFLASAREIVLELVRRLQS